MPRAEAIQISTLSFETKALPELIGFPFVNFDFETKETEREFDPITLATKYSLLVKSSVCHGLCHSLCYEGKVLIHQTSKGLLETSVGKGSPTPKKTCIFGHCPNCDLTPHYCANPGTLWHKFVAENKKILKQQF